MTTPEEHREAKATRQHLFRLRKAAAGGRRLAKVNRGAKPGDKILTFDVTGQLRGHGRRDG